MIFPGPFNGQTKASYLPHIYMNVWCYSTAILDALSEPWIFLPVLYCVCNEYFLLYRHFNCCQEYIWHIIWIVLCFIQLTSYVSCCFTLNANWKIHSFFTLKETSNEKKFSDFFRPFHWPNSSIKSSPHIYERLMLLNSTLGCLVWALNFFSWSICKNAILKVN